MPEVARVTDICSGHNGFSSRSAITGSNDVFINGLAAHRVSDVWEVHCNVSCHDSILSVGSSTVFVNGLSLGRISDSIQCGSSVATGSSNVFAGG